MNNGVYALPGFMAPAAKNWKSQLLTNEDGSVKLCVYVGKPGTKVYYSLGIPGWKWGFIKDAQYFIDKGYPQEVIEEVSKFADYLEEDVPALPEGTVIPDIIINGWPLPITESPIEGKVYWILNIPKFVLPAGDTEVQISANGKLLKYTITRPDFSIHYNDPGYTIPAGTPGGGSGGSSTGGLTANERELLMGAAQRESDNTFSAYNTFTGEVDMSTASVTPPEGWNVEGAELTAEAIQAVVPIAWAANDQVAVAVNGSVAFGSGATTQIGWGTALGESSSASMMSIAVGHAANAGRASASIGYTAKAKDNSIAIGLQSSAVNASMAIGGRFDEVVNGENVIHPCTTEGTGSITIGAGANTLNNGTTESSNSVTIGCKALNQGADSVVIGASAANKNSAFDVNFNVLIGANTSVGGTLDRNRAVVVGCNAAGRAADVAIGYKNSGGFGAVSIGAEASSWEEAVTIGRLAKSTASRNIAIGTRSKAASSFSVALGTNASVSDYGATVIRSTAADGTYTQLYFSGANTPLANTYEEGEAMMGYVVMQKGADGQFAPVAAGTQKLSVLFPNNSTFQPATLGLDDDMPAAKVFHPSDLDLPVEEPQEPEEYTPLPVYPIVEPEIEDINLINAE